MQAKDSQPKTPRAGDALRRKAAKLARAEGGPVVMGGGAPGSEKKGITGARAAATRATGVVMGSGESVTGPAHVANLQALEATDDTHPSSGGGSMARERGLAVPLDLEKEALARVLAGASPAAVEDAMGLTRNYVSWALKRRFGSAVEGRKALVGLVQENALATMAHLGANMAELSAAQAGAVGVALVDRVLALEKSAVDVPKTVDFDVLARVGASLTRLREIVSEGVRH